MSRPTREERLYRLAQRLVERLEELRPEMYLTDHDRWKLTEEILGLLEEKT